jgi:hypothetical protein
MREDVDGFLNFLRRNGQRRIGLSDDRTNVKPIRLGIRRRVRNLPLGVDNIGPAIQFGERFRARRGRGAGEVHKGARDQSVR